MYSSPQWRLSDSNELHHCDAIGDFTCRSGSLIFQDGKRYRSNDPVSVSLVYGDYCAKSTRTQYTVPNGETRRAENVGFTRMGDVAKDQGRLTHCDLDQGQIFLRSSAVHGSLDPTFTDRVLGSRHASQRSSPCRPETSARAATLHLLYRMVRMVPQTSESAMGVIMLL